MKDLCHSLGAIVDGRSTISGLLSKVRGSPVCAGLHKSCSTLLFSFFFSFLLFDYHPILRDLDSIPQPVTMSQLFVLTILLQLVFCPTIDTAPAPLHEQTFGHLVAENQMIVGTAHSRAVSQHRRPIETGRMQIQSRQVSAEVDTGSDLGTLQKGIFCYKGNDIIFCNHSDLDALNVEAQVADFAAILSSVQGSVPPAKRTVSGLPEPTNIAVLQ